MTLDMVTCRVLVVFLTGVVLGLLLTGPYTQSDTMPGWRLNRITGEQRACSVFTGAVVCHRIEEGG